MKNSTVLYSLLFHLVLNVPVSCFAGESDSPGKADPSEIIAELKEFIPQEMSRLGVPGVSMALIRGGELVREKGFGLADVEAKKAVEEGTLFPACSCSKPVSALAALKLAEQGKLDLDTPIEELLKTWKPPDRIFHAPVTVRLILSHRAGLSMHGVPSYAMDEPAARNAREELSHRLKFLSEPGTRFTYSGGGFMILEVILEDLTGKTFNRLMLEEILLPLKMRSSTFEPYEPSFHSRMAMGYYENGSPVGWRVTGGLAAAWLHTTPRDLTRFLIALYRADRLGEKTVVSPRTVKLMLTPTGEATGRDGAYTSLGIFLKDTPLGRLVYHEGSNRGYRCGMWIFLKTGDGLVVMTNSNNGRALCRVVFGKVFPEGVVRDE